MEILNDLLGKLKGWLDALILLTPNIVAALGVVFLFAIIAKYTSRLFARLLNRMSNHSALNDLARKVVRVTIAGVGVLVALHILHLDKAATTFLAGAGIIGLAVGFAFQDMSANFISGIAMAFKRPLEVGELVETNGYLGIVESIELRSTVIKTLDGQHVRIPNKEIFQKSLINLSKGKTRRVDVSVGVSYSDNLETVERVARRAIENVESDKNRDIEVFFTGFGGSSIDLIARFWVDYEKHSDYLRAKSAAIMNIKQAFDAEGISIPFPIRTLELGGSMDEWKSIGIGTQQSPELANGERPSA